MSDVITKTGIVGLGAMGFQMARHMKNRGFDVAGCDVSAEAQGRARTEGIQVLANPAEVGAHATLVIVMVATDAQVEEVVLHSGMLENLKPGSVICIASSTSPNTARDLEAACAKRQVGVLDTPVALGQKAADNGTLTIFCGGAEEAFAKAKPVLSAFGAHVLHTGASGTGQFTKTANNLLLWACIVANYEVLNFAKQFGMDVPKLIKALEHSSGANNSLSRWGESTGKWAEKDLDVALDLAQDIKVPLPLSALVDQLMKNIDREKMRSLLVR